MRLTLQGNRQLAMAFRRFRRNRLALVGAGFLSIVIILAIFAGLIAPRDPTAIDLNNKFALPSSDFLLGSDHFGRDMMSRAIYGARISLLVGGLVVGISGGIGIPLGLVAGYVGGTVDRFIMRIMDSLLTFPPLFLAIAIVGILGPSIINVMIALGLVQLPVFARIVRASVLSVKEQQYIESVRSLGQSPLRIAYKHIIPNILAPVVVEATVTFARAIISEAALSFLGLGIQPPTPSWGRDLSEARSYINHNIWLIIVPTITIMFTVLSVNFVGDGFRDALDPRADESGH